MSPGTAEPASPAAASAILLRSGVTRAAGASAPSSRGLSKEGLDEAPEELDLAPVAAVAAAAAAEEERLLAEVECADDEECEVSDAAEALSQEALSAVRRMRRGTAEECEGEEECMVPM